MYAVTTGTDLLPMTPPARLTRLLPRDGGMRRLVRRSDRCLWRCSWPAESPAARSAGRGSPVKLTANHGRPTTEGGHAAGRQGGLMAARQPVPADKGRI